MKLQLLLLVLVAVVSSQSCQDYIAQLIDIFQDDKIQFAKSISGYVALSGKVVDDLGLPATCQRSANLSYFIAHLQTPGTQNQYNAYVGLCFTNKCSAEQLNINGGFLINAMLNASVVQYQTMTFIEPRLDPEITPGAIVFSLLFLALLLISMKECLWIFFKRCIKQTRKQQQDDRNSYAIQFGQDYDPTLLIVHEKEGFFKKNCILQKLQLYFTPEQNSKIVSFSAFRILSVPLAYYGYLFYLCNIASINYFSFNKEIYQQTFSKIAIAAYYLPDTLFFISAFIFAKKAFLLIELENNPVRPLLRLFGKKLLKLYPLYWAVILMYWQISPSWHGGPVWYEYEKQAGYCNSGWWRSLLLIDNWFENGCYNFVWFIPVQFQLSLISIILLIIYSKNKKIGLAVIGLALVTSWVLVLVISSPLPSSLETTLSYSSQRYFKSTYSHLPFYLLGVLNAYLGFHQGIKQLLKSFTQIRVLRIISLIIGTLLIFLVVNKPQVWQNLLGFELGLARTGMFLGIYLFLFWGMFDGNVRHTSLHKYSSLWFGALMVGGIVVGSNYWTLQSFPYLDSKYLFDTTLTNVLLGVLLGGFLGVLVWKKPQKEEQELML